LHVSRGLLTWLMRPRAVQTTHTALALGGNRTRQEATETLQQLRHQHYYYDKDTNHFFRTPDNMQLTNHDWVIKYVPDVRCPRVSPSCSCISGPESGQSLMWMQARLWGSVTR